MKDSPNKGNYMFNKLRMHIFSGIIALDRQQMHQVVAAVKTALEQGVPGTILTQLVNDEVDKFIDTTGQKTRFEMDIEHESALAEQESDKKAMK
eukprot:7021938-Ditylum_brightwellii.AAC.1